MASNTQKTRIKRNQKKKRGGKSRKREIKAAVRAGIEAKVDVL
jgi:hypothetical protein